MNARAQFTQWVKDEHPELFRQAVEYAENWRLRQADEQGNPATINGLADTATAEPQSFWQKFGEGLTSLGTAYLGYKGQKQVLDINLQRAQSGLPPIDPRTGAPTVRTAIDLSPEMMARISGVGLDMASILKWGLLGLGGFMLVKQFAGGSGDRKSRR